MSLVRHQHLPSALRSWSGDAIAYCAGDALVIDTANFTESIGLTGNYDGHLHLTERFWRIDPDTMLYSATVDDPTAFARPWTMQLAMKRSDVPLFEFACHEGNCSMTNMLRAARAAEGP